MESEINTKTLIDDNHQLNKISTGNIMYLLQVIARHNFYNVFALNNCIIFEINV